MFSPKKWLQRLRLRPKQELARLAPELRELKADLMRLLAKGEKLEALVAFYTLTSQWHDRGDIARLIMHFEKSNTGEFTRIIQDLVVLNATFRRYGRGADGYNRTGHGEAVNEKNVYFGAAWIPAKSVAELKKLKGSDVRMHSFHCEFNGMNEYEVLSRFAREYLAEIVLDLYREIDYVLPLERHLTQVA